MSQNLTSSRLTDVDHGSDQVNCSSHNEDGEPAPARLRNQLSGERPTQDTRDCGLKRGKRERLQIMMPLIRKKIWHLPRGHPTHQCIWNCKRNAGMVGSYFSVIWQMPGRVASGEAHGERDEAEKTEMSQSKQKARRQWEDASWISSVPFTLLLILFKKTVNFKKWGDPSDSVVPLSKL